MNFYHHKGERLNEKYNLSWEGWPRRGTSVTCAD